jgi:hypothetical protein
MLAEVVRGGRGAGGGRLGTGFAQFSTFFSKWPSHIISQKSQFYRQHHFIARSFKLDYRPLLSMSGRH